MQILKNGGLNMKPKRFFKSSRPLKVSGEETTNVPGAYESSFNSTNIKVI